jgi:hypothetical protein
LPSLVISATGAAPSVGGDVIAVAPSLSP